MVRAETYTSSVGRYIGMTALLFAVTATLWSQTPARSLPFCADAPGVKVPARLLPVDEGVTRPDFFTFRASLQTAIAARDVDAVVSMASPDIRMGFGGDDGARVLKEHLAGGDAAEYWRSLGRILALGGAFKGATTFEAPYVFSNWPEGAEAFECAAVTGAHVAVRRAATVNAELVTRASYAIVRLVERPPSGHWSQVQLSSGQAGYMHNDYLWGPTALLAVFTLSDGQWRLSALVSGD